MSGSLALARTSLWVVSLIALSLGGASAAHAHSRSATELETKLFAPCCYVQTLDVHESDLADKLRREIEQRLSAGEPALRIEDDLVARYGERIRAVPRDSDPRSGIPLLVGIALAVGLIGLGSFALRWQRDQRREGAHGETSAIDSAYDHALDEALRRSDRDDPPPVSAA